MQLYLYISCICHLCPFFLGISVLNQSKNSESIIGTIFYSIIDPKSILRPNLSNDLRGNVYVILWQIRFTLGQTWWLQSIQKAVSSGIWVFIFSHRASRAKDMAKTKNRKESILKNAKLIKKLILTIANVGTKSANRGNTIGYTPSKQYQFSICWFHQIFISLVDIGPKIA